MSETAIGWTLPPWVDKGMTLNHQLGCKHAGGPGCDHCWAESDTWIRQNNPNPKMAAANAGLVVMRDNGRPRWSGEYNLLPQRFAEPFKTRQRWGIFTPSKSDPWYEPMMATEEGRRHAAAAIGMAAALPQHTFFVLTKRTRGALEHEEWIRDQSARANMSPAQFCVFMLHDRLAAAGEHKVAARAIESFRDEWPVRNLWVLASTENQECFDKRVPWLLKLTMAGVLGISAEPLLGPITLGPDAGERLGWVIAGAESGAGARPCHPDWARSLRNQCSDAEVPYFWKQWGAFGPSGVDIVGGVPVFRMFDNYTQWVDKAGYWMGKGDICVDRAGRVLKVGRDFADARFPVAIMRKGKAENLLDGKKWEQFPEEPRR